MQALSPSPGAGRLGQFATRKDRIFAGCNFLRHPSATFVRRKRFPRSPFQPEGRAWHIPRSLYRDSKLHRGGEDSGHLTGRRDRARAKSSIRRRKPITPVSARTRNAPLERLPFVSSCDVLLQNASSRKWKRGLGALSLIEWKPRVTGRKIAFCFADCPPGPAVALNRFPRAWLLER